jgi:hypothetical protein
MGVTSSSWVTNNGIALFMNIIEKFHISSEVLVSKFPVGSSARIIEGLFTKALAMATRWRWPPDN